MNNLKYKIGYGAALAVLVFAVTGVALAQTWNPPTADPTGGNTPAPINVGDSPQLKEGGLRVNNLLTFLSGGVFSNGTLEFGFGVAGKNVSAGKIGYQRWSPNALDIVGAGVTAGERKVKIWDDLILSGDLCSDEDGTFRCITVNKIINNSGLWEYRKGFGENIFNINTGNVGIGLPVGVAPQSKLDVAGDVCSTVGGVRRCLSSGGSGPGLWNLDSDDRITNLNKGVNINWDAPSGALAVDLRVGPSYSLPPGAVPKVLINNTKTSNVYDLGLLVKNNGNGWAIQANGHSGTGSGSVADRGKFGVRAIGTSIALMVDGPFYMPSGSGPNKVLTSDANGFARWMSTHQFDINGDGLVNSSDRQQVVNCNLGTQCSDLIIRNRADINKDGTINAVDIQLIENYLSTGGDYFNGGGDSSLPSGGANGQLIRWNGSSWVTTSAIRSEDITVNGNPSQVIKVGTPGSWSVNMDVNGSGLFNSLYSNSIVNTGSLRVRGGSPASGKVLTSDASGNATWQTPARGISFSDVSTRDSGNISLTGNLNISASCNSNEVVVGGGVSYSGASLAGAQPYSYPLDDQTWQCTRPAFSVSAGTWKCYARCIKVN